MPTGGFLLILRDEERVDRIDEAISERRYFTSTITSNKWKGRSREIALVSFDGTSIQYLSLADRQDRTATFQTRIRFGELYLFESTIALTSILETISPTVRRYFEPALESSDGYWIPPETWLEVLRVIALLRPESESVIQELNQLLNESRTELNSINHQILSEERDAVVSLVRYSGLERFANVWISNRSSEQRDPQSEVQPFMLSTRDDNIFTILEDQAIDYDASNFGDWSQLEHYITGERLFTNGQTHLLIRNVNRQPLERTLGVDLVYFNLTNNAFILVQYKRMTRREGQNSFVYRVNDQFREELQRMREFETTNQENYSSPSTLLDYRLNYGSFFFKFHRSEFYDPTSASLIPGMHVPLDCWDIFESQPESRGPRNGLFVSEDNMTRYLTSTDFAALVGNAMLGSSGNISTILNELVKPYVTDLSHSVMVGVSA